MKKSVLHYQYNYGDDKAMCGAYIDFMYLGYENSTITRKAVTCKRCLAKMRAKELI